MVFGMLMPAFSRVSLISFFILVVTTVVCVIENIMYTNSIQRYKLSQDII